MPVYLQIILIVLGVIIFYFVALYLTGWKIRGLCFKIIKEMEDQRAFSANKAVSLQSTRGNFFKMGLGNYRPKALEMLIAEKLVVKTNNGKYYLDKDNLAAMKKIVTS